SSPTLPGRSSRAPSFPTGPNDPGVGSLADGRRRVARAAGRRLPVGSRGCPCTGGAGCRQGDPLQHPIGAARWRTPRHHGGIRKAQFVDVECAPALIRGGEVMEAHPQGPGLLTIGAAPEAHHRFGPGGGHSRSEAGPGSTFVGGLQTGRSLGRPDRTLATRVRSGETGGTLTRSWAREPFRFVSPGLDEQFVPRLRCSEEPWTGEVRL